MARYLVRRRLARAIGLLGRWPFFLLCHLGLTKIDRPRFLCATKSATMGVFVTCVESVAVPSIITRSHDTGGCCCCLLTCRSRLHSRGIHSFIPCLPLRNPTYGLRLSSVRPSFHFISSPSLATILSFKAASPTPAQRNSHHQCSASSSPYSLSRTSATCSSTPST